MTPHETLEIVDYAKGLFRFMTPIQGAALRDMLSPFPDTVYPREMLRALAIEKPAGEEDRWQEGNISLTAVNERLKAELRRRGLTSADQERRKQRREESSIDAYRIAVARRISEMSDEELAERKTQAFASLNEGARAFLEKHDPRKCAVLQALIYKAEHSGGGPNP